MNEAEWRKCADPKPLLKRLRGARASARKLRLTVCACCRATRPLFRDKLSAQAVEVAEQQADDLVLRKEVRTIRRALLELLRTRVGWREEALDQMMKNLTITGVVTFRKADWPLVGILAAVRALQDNIPIPQVREVLALLSDTAREVHDRKGRDQARKRQCELIRDIFGPFRKARIGPSVLAWNDGTIRKMAQLIYDERRFNDLPILADALEEAGCTDPDILAHCRQPGEHARGCWLVDRLLRTRPAITS